VHRTCLYRWKRQLLAVVEPRNQREATWTSPHKNYPLIVISADTSGILPEIIEPLVVDESFLGKSAMHVWNWLNANSGAVQSVLAAATILVLGFTAWAIKLQADAARALTRVAVEQTNAAKAAASAAEAQARLTADQIELSTAPLLIFEPDARVNSHQWRLVNRGLGTAFQVHYWQGGFEHFHPRYGSAWSFEVLNPSTLAPGKFVYLKINPQWPSWTVKYRGIDDQARATKLNRNNSGGQHYIIRRGGKEITLDDFEGRNGEKAIGDWTE
jgi:hypothetical protein